VAVSDITFNNVESGLCGDGCQVAVDTGTSMLAGPSSLVSSLQAGNFRSNAVFTQCESGNTKLLQGESGARGNLGTFCMVSLMIAVCFLHRPGQADCSNYDSLPNIGFKIGNKAEDFCPRCSILIYFAFSRS